MAQGTPSTYTCGICGFVMNEAMECPRGKLIIDAKTCQVSECQ